MKCPICGGKEMVEHMKKISQEDGTGIRPCHLCHGTGEIETTESYSIPGLNASDVKAPFIDQNPYLDINLRLFAKDDYETCPLCSGAGSVVKGDYETDKRPAGYIIVHDSWAHVGGPYRTKGLAIKKKILFSKGVGCPDGLKYPIESIHIMSVHFLDDE